MNKHVKYLKYVLEHKFWVGYYAITDYGLIWRGIKHDWTKFLPSEWFAYAGYDFSKGLPKNTGYIHQMNPADVAFNVAMNHHHKRNTHHWEYWVLVNKDGSNLALNMPYLDKCEMLADWRGAGKAQGRPNTVEWYHVNRDNMNLHPATRTWIENQLSYEDYVDGLIAATNNIAPDEVKRQRLADTEAHQ